ncbi:MAG TPA: alpha-isopropylmalate synthase regulatory domain-containing protein [Candidatus Limnocylindria bacterium]|nr:alpha-isopropylmalate synthase regulatory domain-containing protein [Candidatus Limnocylindria bacterium]
MTMTNQEPNTAAAEGLTIERWSATSGSDRPSRANLILAGGGHRWRAHADGNGAVDALMRAVDTALEPLLGGGVELATFDVHATRAGHEASASIAVSVRPRDTPDGPLYPGRAVHENVLEASLAAYVDAINTLLADRGVDIGASVPSAGATDRHETDPEHRTGTKDRLMSAYNS